AERAGLERFARCRGYDSRDTLAAALLGHMNAVQGRYAALFENAPAQEAERRGLVFPADADDRETCDKLAVMGFRRPLEASAAVRRWLAGAPRGMRGEVALALVAELGPRLLGALRRCDNPH